MNQRIPNPDCRDGKHGNCDGHGWDMDADTAVRCPCTCHSKETSIHMHGPLVLDPAMGWQCDTCGDWLPLDYKGPQRIGKHTVPLQRRVPGLVCTAWDSNGKYWAGCKCYACTRTTAQRTMQDHSDTYCI